MVCTRTLKALPLVGLLTVILGCETVAARGVAAELSRLLEQIPADRIETGILYDRTLGLSRIEEHDGSPLSRPASLSEWRQMYHEISQASLDQPDWLPLESVLAKGRTALEGGVIPLAVMNFRYDRIRADALETGALVVQGDRVVLGSGDPFQIERVFAAAVFKERTYRGSHVVFRFGRDDYYSNEGAVPATVEIDFDDGRGLMARAGEEWPVRYATAGQKTVRLRFTFPDGAARYASLTFDVLSLGTPTPDDTLQVTATIPYLGQFGSGEAYVYLAPEHASLTNPILVIEGFDLDNSMNWDELYALLNREQLLESLRSLGFDAVVLNFTDATSYVQRNAFVIVELITQVNALIHPSLDCGLVGASMGGLAARYALAYMETQGLDHRVRTFISFDSPQTGANIPLGIQYWVAFFASESVEAAALLAALDSPAARQMLVYHHTEPPGGTGESDPLRAVLMADLTAVGGYPDEARTVAVANGSGTQANQGFNPGDQIISWEYSSFAVDIIGNIWAVPNVSSALIFHGLIDIIFTDPDEQMVNVSNTRPFDNAPGGSRASMEQMDMVAAPYGDIVALHGSHCFIPTTSALDLDSEDLFYDIANDPNILAHTPFDAVYFPSENQEHVAITPENAVWLTMELQSGTTAVAQAGLDLTRPFLLPASPNPFDGSTRIRFALPRAGWAQLAAYDGGGRQVAVILDQRLEAGEHQAVWDVSNPRGKSLGPGIYFLRLSGDGFATSRKVLLR